MNDSFFLFQLLFACLWAAACWFGFGWLAYKNYISANKGILGFFIIGMMGGLLCPVIVLRFVVFPQIAQYETHPATEIREEVNNTEITQWLIYEDGTELNLTERTGKYYTKLPDSELNREYCTFLWVIEWDQRWYSGLDFVKRN